MSNELSGQVSGDVYQAGAIYGAPASNPADAAEQARLVRRWNARLEAEDQAAREYAAQRQAAQRRYHRWLKRQLALTLLAGVCALTVWVMSFELNAPKGMIAPFAFIGLISAFICYQSRCPEVPS
ncbi:hypothetical protein [Streptomyces sp. NPDC018045]|uniref:hypothetical protein n=1 Tax=Streptomyces sp. NPDC018045 TaxID=3365037 RepID=UPI00379055C7